eukprot:2300645-Amphidinium_carterae.1
MGSSCCACLGLVRHQGTRAELTQQAAAQEGVESQEPEKPTKHRGPDSKAHNKTSIGPPSKEGTSQNYSTQTSQSAPDT